ncbi:armadillo-type protein [Vararia minispora EC-137]|uniref:Armadillo-type protein n=1 Tax=Vararia minispora EC-137 TaxID=1314806 RepID=A0ACB8QV77_9AGAM|nr:armadillo-type protein [Vararia minispora EC-137]
MQKFAHDLRLTLAPSYDDILSSLLRLLPRHIAPEALTTLLATLSTIFKYLLVPSSDAETLPRTWSALCDTLPSCNPEIQRAFSEVWGSVLRRLKSAPRAKAMELMGAGLEGVEDACAWSVVFACKSVSQTLHTTAPSIIKPLLTLHLMNAHPSATHMLLRRIITALIHHCKGVEQFAPVADVLVEDFVDAVAVGESGTLERIIGVVTVAASVRQGSRLSAKQLASISSHLQNIPLVPSLYSSLLCLTISVLTAGDMPLWMSAGRKLIEYSWSSPAFGIRLCGALSDLDWGGWKLLELPHVQKRVVDLLETDTSLALDLVAGLWEKQRLGGLEHPVRQKLDAWATARLKLWTLDADKASELHQLLTFSPLLPSFTSALTFTIQNLLQTPDPRTEFAATSANATWALAACLKALAIRKNTSWKEVVDLSAWYAVILEKWAWAEGVIEAFGQVVNTAYVCENCLITMLTIHILASHIISHSHLLREAILLLLTSPSITSTPSSQHLLDKLLQAEQVSLDVAGVRERTLRITRLPQFVPEVDGPASELAVRWLVSQFKVGLRPIWAPTAKSLATLVERCGEVVWKTLFEELSGVVHPGDGQEEGQRPRWMVSEKEDADDVREEERSWRDPRAHKIRGTAAVWNRQPDTRWEAKRVASLQSKDRFDPQSYETQLLVTLGHAATLAEKHNRVLIPLFLSLGGPDGPIQLPRSKLAAWLALFSKFRNPKALHSSQKLYALYVRLLSHPDRPLQTLALSCVLTFKSPRLVGLEDTLRALLDETKWRDELTNLDIATLPLDDRAEAIDVIIRLLFGVMLEKKSRLRGGDRRAAVLNALGGCSEGELDLLVKLMLQSLFHELAEKPAEEIFAVTQFPTVVPQRQQLGFLNTLADVLKSLGSRIVHRWDPLIRVTVNMTATAQAIIDASKGATITAAEEGEEGDETDAEDGVPQAATSLKALRSIRQQGLKRLTDFFGASLPFDFAPYLPLIFQSIISPRLATLDRENTQTPSALVELFFIWSSTLEYAPFLVDYDERVLPQLYGCIIAPSVKPPVINRVLDVVARLLDLAGEDEGVAEKVMKRYVPTLLTNLGILIGNTKHDKAASTPLIGRQISILSGLAKYIDDSAQAALFLSLFTPLLRKPNRIVGERMKADVIQIVMSLIPLVADLADTTSHVYRRTFEVLALCFQALRSRAARTALVSAFRQLSTVDVSLQSLANLIDGLNAYSEKKLEEPDFDRRLEAFALLTDEMHSSLSSYHWLPVLYNMLYFIQDPNELAIRTSSAQGLKLFIDAVSLHPDTDYQLIFLRKLYPALKNGLRSRNEFVRAEVLGVISFAVRKCDNLTVLQDMRVLLADGDEEANVFNNIHHVQLHRRVRALRRLCEFCESEQLRGSTLAEIFVPLVGNFITSAASVDHQLVNAAITATGTMARQLAWGPYISLVNQYLKLSKTKDALQRVYIRTLVSILDNFHFPVGDTVQNENKEASDDQDEEDEETTVDKAATTRIEDAVNNSLLPALLKHLEDRDEEGDDSLRLPISVGIVKVAQHLPEATREAQISRLLTVLSQVFRSKSSDTRDLARDTLCRIATILGPSYLPAILRELRVALTRGPHVHILAFVTHALLVHVTAPEHAKVFAILDGCVPDVVHISSEVVFGEPGKDVQSEGFKTKVKEVRSSASKGLDSFAIMARHITPRKISGLLLPLRGVMQETEALKTMQLVDDVLRRIASGLNSNEHLVPPELLVLCHTLISQNAKFLQNLPTPQRKDKRGDAIVQLKREEVTAVNHYATNSFRFVALGLDMFVTAFRRGRFDFSDPRTIARLEPMVTVIGNTLYATNSHVLSQGLKASSAILKCPLKNIDKSLPVFVKQIVTIVRQTGNTDSDVVQTALKTLSTLLRERAAASIGEKDLLYLLELLGPDIQEPSRQASVFAILRAIVARRFIVPEIYDIMERVAEVMVTSQSPNVQELCRGVLLQFLLDYPQGKGRLKQQMAFLAKNLSYTFESGRRSVMEFLSVIVVKFDGALIEEYADLLFVALVMVLANDDAPKCREMAAEVVKALFKRLGGEHQRGLMSHVHAWAMQHAQTALMRVACQVYGLALDAFRSESSPYLSTMLEDLGSLVSRSASLFDREEEEENSMDVDNEWQVPYQAFATFEKLLRIFPDQESGFPWHDVASHLLFPHAWVRVASSRLLGLLFSRHPPSAPRPGFPVEGLDFKDIASKLSLQLKSEYLDDPLSLQVVKNLFWVGKCFCALPEPASSAQDEESEDGEEDTAEAEGEETDDNQPDNPLAWLFSKLSYQARSAHIARRNRTANQENWYLHLSAVFRWFAAMATFMEPNRLSRFLVHILTPVYRITEETMIKDPHMDDLKSTAIELQELLQQKIGTSDFARVYAKIRQHVLEVQHERRTARITLEAVNPEAAAKQKMRRAEVKRDSRKRKNAAFA